MNKENIYSINRSWCSSKVHSCSTICGSRTTNNKAYLPCSWSVTINPYNLRGSGFTGAQVLIISTSAAVEDSGDPIVSKMVSIADLIFTIRWREVVEVLKILIEDTCGLTFRRKIIGLETLLNCKWKKKVAISIREFPIWWIE